MRSTVRVFAVELAFTFVLVLVAEVLFRLFGWDRFWALVAVFLTGHVARAGLARRRRAVLGAQAPSPSR